MRREIRSFPPCFSFLNTHCVAYNFNLKNRIAATNCIEIQILNFASDRQRDTTMLSRAHNRTKSVRYFTNKQYLLVEPSHSSPRTIFVQRPPPQQSSTRWRILNYRVSQTSNRHSHTHTHKHTHTSRHKAIAQAHCVHIYRPIVCEES